MSDGENAKTTMQVVSALRDEVGLLSHGRLLIMKTNSKKSVLAIKSSLNAGTLNPHAWSHAPLVAMPTNMNVGTHPVHLLGS